MSSPSSETTVVSRNVDPPGGPVRAAAMTFGSRIQVAAGEAREVDAKSLLSVLSLGAKGGTTLRLRADGEDASGAVAELAELVAGLSE